MPEAAAASPRRPRGRKGLVLGGLALAALLAGGHAGWRWWSEGRFLVSTDDAYVQADLSLVSAKITGYVSAIAVADNQHVRAGDVLLRIDDGDHRIALEQAQARLAELSSTLARIDAEIAAAESGVAQVEAQLAASEAALTAARAAAGRARGLAERRVTSQADLDSATETLATAEANRNAARAAIAGATARVGVLKAQRVEAAATRRALDLAVAQVRRDLDFTTLRAPFDGTVANIAIKQGELVSAGARLAAVVPDRGMYVEANLKETQLAAIREGQSARLSVDAFEGAEIEGRVVSVAPATGAVFSLLPAENATGNFTKIVQRVPVRIALPDGTPGLRAGLSVEVEIDTRTGPENPGPENPGLETPASGPDVAGLAGAG